MEGIIIDNVANQITIESTNIISSMETKSQSRVDFIKSQKNNTYSSMNYPPFL